MVVLFDLPLAELRVYKPVRQEPADHASFWEETLAEARRHPLAARFDPVDYHLQTVETLDLSFAGYGGHAVKGWFTFSAHCQARALFSVALMDDTCPPSTVFAAYNHYAGPKEIRVWQFNHHEGGQSFQAIEKLKYLAELWG